jgi:hypothetical protein
MTTEEVPAEIQKLAEKFILEQIENPERITVREFLESEEQPAELFDQLWDAIRRAELEIHFPYEAGGRG